VAPTAPRSKPARSRDGLLPALAVADSREKKPDALVVPRVHPEHAIEDVGGLVSSAEPPEAEPVPVHAAQERPVIDETPRKHTV